MFFGKGDTSKLEGDEQETLAHLRRMVETGHVVALDPAKAQVALRAIDFYARWESAWQLVQSVRNVLILVGGLLTAWWVTEGYVVKWLLEKVTQT